MANEVKDLEVLEAPVVDQGDPMATMIAQMASNPQVNVDALERLMALYERSTARRSEDQFNASMSVAQAKMRPIAADMENPQTRSKYASYAALDRALRPIYTAAGFGVSFDTADSPIGEHVRVVAYVTHSAGGARTYHLDMPADGKGARGNDVMTKTHATGAAMSYGMRYLLRMIWNVAIGEDDRDGNRVESQKPAPPKGFGDYWKQLVKAAKQGKAALEAQWSCSEDEPYKSYRAYIAKYGKAEMDALRAQAKTATEG